MSNETSVIVAGFGGQGVLFAGQLLAYAGMDSGRHVTWIPSYGPEMRGGTANCTVIISEAPIGAPIVDNPDIAVVLNQPSYEKYAPLVRTGGLLVLNSDLVSPEQVRKDIDVVAVPASTIAENQGNIRMLNMVTIGAVLGRRSVLSLDQVEDALRGHLPASKSHLLEDNLTVLRRGYGLAREAVAA